MIAKGRNAKIQAFGGFQYGGAFFNLNRDIIYFQVNHIFTHGVFLLFYGFKRA
jgi:hypothetical protein